MREELSAIAVFGLPAVLAVKAAITRRKTSSIRQLTSGRTEPAHAACICHRACETSWAGPGDRSLQDRHPQPETPTESHGALSRTDVW